MPANNQLLDGNMLRVEVVFGNFRWSGGDPGTGVLPDNRIVTWGEYKTYIATSGTNQLPDNECAYYSIMLDWRILLPAPTGLSATNFSFCDGGTAIYRIFLSWNNSGPYQTQIYDSDSYLGITVGVGVGSVDLDTFDGDHNFNVRHFDGIVTGPPSNVESINVANLSC